MTQSDVHVKAEEIHPPLKQAHEMPYAPAIEVVGASQILFRSAATPSPKYHQHPLPRDEHALPDDIEEQTRSATAGSRSVVDPKRLTWRNVMKITKYLTDIREADAMRAVMNEGCGDHRRASTMICVNNLSSPGARIELNTIAVGGVS